MTAKDMDDYARLRTFTDRLPGRSNWRERLRISVDGSPAVFKTVCGALLRRPGWVRFPSSPPSSAGRHGQVSNAARPSSSGPNAGSSHWLSPKTGPSAPSRRRATPGRDRGVPGGSSSARSARLATEPRGPARFVHPPWQSEGNLSVWRRANDVVATVLHLKDQVGLPQGRIGGEVRIAEP